MYHLSSCLVSYTPPVFWYANVEFTVCLPYINSSVFRYLRHIWRKQISGHPFFFRHQLVMKNKPSRRMPIVLGIFTDCKSLVLRAIMNTCYESYSTIGSHGQECTTMLIKYDRGGRLNNKCSTLLFVPFRSLCFANGMCAYFGVDVYLLY